MNLETTTKNAASALGWLGPFSKSKKRAFKDSFCLGKQPFTRKVGNVQFIQPLNPRRRKTILPPVLAVNIADMKPPPLSSPQICSYPDDLLFSSPAGFL